MILMIWSKWNAVALKCIDNWCILQLSGKLWWVFLRLFILSSENWKVTTPNPALVVSPVMSQMVRRQRLILLEKFTFYYHHFTRTCIQATFVTTSTITLVIHIVILTQSSELCNCADTSCAKSFCLYNLELICKLCLYIHIERESRFLE